MLRDTWSWAEKLYSGVSKQVRKISKLLPGAAQRLVAILVELRAELLPDCRPRAAAAAEVFWTGGALADGERNIGEALPRLHDWRYRAVRRGVQAAPLQPYWCALRPGACDAD